MFLSTWHDRTEGCHLFHITRYRSGGVLLRQNCWVGRFQIRGSCCRVRKAPLPLHKFAVSMEPTRTTRGAHPPSIIRRNTYELFRLHNINYYFLGFIQLYSTIPWRPGKPLAFVIPTHIFYLRFNHYTQPSDFLLLHQISFFRACVFFFLSLDHYHHSKSDDMVFVKHPVPIFA